MSDANSLAKVMRDLERYAEVATQIRAGLNGTPFRWGSNGLKYRRALAEAMGVYLVSKTAAKLQGYQIKDGAEPVGEIYYPAPISKYVEVFVLECQCEPIPIARRKDTEP